MTPARWLSASVRHTRPALLLRCLPLTLTMSFSTFTIPRNLDHNGSATLPVSCPADLSREDLLRFPAFRIWLTTLQHSLSRQQQPSHEFSKDPYVLRKIDIQSVDRFGGGRLGFLKFKAEVSNENGETLPGSVFLRGGSVGMLVSGLPSLYRQLTTLRYNANAVYLAHSSYFNQTMCLHRQKTRSVPS